jgi:hypothetical protein
MEEPKKLAPRTNDLLAYCPMIRDELELLEILGAARDDYVHGELAGPKALSTKYPMLPYEVCQKLVTAYGWREMRAKHLEDLQISSAVDYAQFVRDQRTVVAKGIVDQISPVLKRMSEEIGVALDGTGQYRTIDARRLAECLAQMSDTLMKAVAIDGTVPELPDTAAVDGKDKGKRPWVSVTASGPVSISSGDGQKPGRGAPEEEKET